MLAAWITGATSITDPGVAAAIEAAGAGQPSAIHLGEAPPMTPLAVGRSGAVTAVIGETPDQLLLSTNVDDLDPRVWPDVLAELLAAGALDAWLTPILMKKGRPAHTLSVLAPASNTAVIAVVLEHTSAIGLRMQPVTKLELAREFAAVDVRGVTVSIKVARYAGRVVNVMPEWSDVAAAAAALGMPTKRVLALATAAAAHLWENHDAS